MISVNLDATVVEIDCDVINAREYGEKGPHIGKTACDSAENLDQDFEKRAFKTQKNVESIGPQVCKIGFEPFGALFIAPKSFCFQFMETESIGRTGGRSILIGIELKPFKKFFIKERAEA